MHESDFTQTPVVVGLVSFAKSLGVTLEMSEDANALVIEWISNHGKPGAGARVMAHAIARSDEINKPLILDAHEGNPKLINYYAKLGFKPWTGELREFGGEWEHGMRREPVNPAEIAFKRWFADSVVRDANGAPQVVYHGTLKDFSTFQPSESGMIFTTPSAEVAAMYGSRHATGKDVNGHCVMPLYVCCKNPFDANRLEHVEKVVGLVDSTQLALEMEELSQSSWEPEQALRWLRKGEWQTMECKATVDALKIGGFDGAYVHELGIVSLAVFDPRQLKSALANSGAYDPQDPDITDRRALAASQALAWLQQGKKAALRA